MAILLSQYSNWCMDFHKLCKFDSCEEFEHQWSQVMTKYDMLTNKHVSGLYQIKHFWVPCYLHDYFFGGMTTTGSSESINVFIKRFVSSHINLTQFIEQISHYLSLLSFIVEFDFYLFINICSLYVSLNYLQFVILD